MSDIADRLAGVPIFYTEGDRSFVSVPVELRDEAVEALREKDRRIAGLAARLREYEGDTAWSREKADRDDWDWMTGRGRYAQ